MARPRFGFTRQPDLVHQIVARSGRTCVGHGVGYSIGASAPQDRHDRWLAERAWFCASFEK